LDSRPRSSGTCGTQPGTSHDPVLRRGCDPIRPLPGRQDLPTDVEITGRQHVEAFIADQLARRTAASAANRYKSLQQFFKWAEDEGIDQPVPVVPDADIVALLRSCEGRD